MRLHTRPSPIDGTLLRLSLVAAAVLPVVVLLARSSPQDRDRFEPVLLLPLLWVALRGSSAELAVGLGGLTAGLALASIDPSGRFDWARELAFLCAAGSTALIVQRLVGQVRMQIADVERVTEVVRDVSERTGGDGARAALCEAIAQLCGATAALLWEPDGDGSMVLTAAHGSVVAVGARLDLSRATRSVAEAMRSGRPAFLDRGSAPFSPQLAGTASALLVPVANAGQLSGALVIGWPQRVPRLSGRLAAAIDLFAAEAVHAIERADLLRQVEQHASDLEAVVEMARRLSRTTDARDARTSICRAVLEACDGMFVVLMEPDGTGDLVATAVTGAEVPPSRVSLEDQGSATVDVFRSLEPFFLSDLATHPAISPRLVDATGAVSALWQPVVADGAPVGVLLVAWDRPVRRLSDRAAAAVGLFAAEAAVAIERADLLARLDGLNRMLSVQIEALRVSDQLKTDFVSSVSHELRTPLASILGYLDVLLEGAAGDLTVDQAEFLGIVDTNARRLLRLINDLLTLSGLESGRMTIRAEPVDLRRLVETNLLDQLPALAEKRLGLSTVLPDEPVPAEVDPERFGQVITNILSNAIKFTPEGGRVSVTLRPAAGDAVLDIADTGIGIAQSDADRLCERFFRAGNATDRAIPGTGLGLAICKGIVDAHGGALSVDSALDLGTTVSVRIPRTRTIA